MSLLQGVLRSQKVDSLERNFSNIRINQQAPANDDSDDELINVTSTPGTPARSRAPSRPSSRPTSRASSPTRGAYARPVPRPLHLTKKSSSDPLRTFTTEVSQRIFRHLNIVDLATCARVSKKWNRSQTINYVWFQHYRRENFHDESLPPGKWSKRESKQNWRLIYLQSNSNRTPPSGPLYSPSSKPSSSSVSGYHTPKELNEEKWRLEAEGQSKPNKVEMREMYKELGGRKSRGKTKLGSSGIRDRAGWGADDNGY
ncbi:hypothetical protein SERLA73DRAFT_62986 [Serpula lacrymans var. lacrymans S7.3]|uniref:F-box domain-containing protein n=1 Tax=Serpula lacrymans var. lacrymans (strain S7.3) TaxID=936435 RepID=F8QBZ2_SERL3|nr:hypothetical protein SERLA73DRAFT_62986 [Serpula lacrymans var. lacrymans S7.3]